LCRNSLSTDLICAWNLAILPVHFVDISSSSRPCIPLFLHHLRPLLHVPFITQYPFCPHSPDRRHSSLASKPIARRHPSFEIRRLPHQCPPTWTPHCRPRLAHSSIAMDLISIPVLPILRYFFVYTFRQVRVRPLTAYFVPSYAYSPGHLFPCLHPCFAFLFQPFLRGSCRWPVTRSDLLIRSSCITYLSSLCTDRHSFEVRGSMHPISLPFFYKGQQSTWPHTLLPSVLRPP
jgi:hypothetical protein